MMRRALIAAAVTVAVGVGPASAWELETHVGLTHEAALHAQLDAWLRERGLDSGLYETLALEPGARRGAHDGEHFVLDDRTLLDELALLDAALGVSPDGARQPALGWLLAGAALEGARMDRVRNHFLDLPHAGRGLAELGPTGSERLRIEAARDGSGTVRGIFTGANFDGTGERADRWVDAADNTLSRLRLIDELERAAAAPTPGARQAALARALACIGAIEHVLQAVGDPAHARGDFTINYTVAGAPLERWVAERYGRSLPPPSAPGATPTTLARFFTSADGTGLGDEAARAFVSPGTLPHGATYPRGEVGKIAEQLLPRIERRSIQLLDFLLRGALVVDEDGAFRVGALGLGRGHLTYLEEGIDGVRHVVISRDTEGGPTGTMLLAGDRRARGILVYRGVDANGEPITVSAIAGK